MLLALMTLGPLWLLSTAVVAEVQPWEVTFTPPEVLELPIDTYRTVQFKTTDLAGLDNGVVTMECDNQHIASAVGELKLPPLASDGWSGYFNVTGNFLGYAKIRMKVRDKDTDEVLKQSDPINVTVVRILRLVDYLFTASIAVLVAIIYINFGCVLDWDILKKTMKKPIGPVIGFASQFIFMPLISFGLGKVLFPDSVQMQLGLFFTGVSPGGGGSNVWTYALEGNLNLSMAMTTISTFAAFVMMPLWIFTLGQLIFSEANITIPYFMIAGFAIALVIPLSIGFLIKRHLPRVSKFLVGILKPLCIFFLFFVIIFASATNLFMFKLFSWRIVIGGLGLPWIGFFLGMLAASLLRQPPADIMAIAIETGIQNTGIAIFLLQALGQPDADLTSVVPVAVSVMTPFPLIFLFIFRKWGMRCRRKETTDKIKKCPPEDENTNDLLI